MIRNVVACILAGGEGKRLFPLTAQRAKPAVRFGGSYRLIDFPLSNCVNSDIRKILILSQYKAHSLEPHLRVGWSFLRPELGDYLASIPPQQLGRIRYQGTADAVYRNLPSLDRAAPAYVLILASDHVYRMDYRRLFRFHLEQGADVTVATFPVQRHRAHQFGIVTADGRGNVVSFLEKPKHISALPGGISSMPASMGIYLFTYDILRQVLLEDSRRSSMHDFGGEILPRMVGEYRVAAYPFVEGIDQEPAYWRDVGTTDAYWEAHMDLVGPHPRFRLEHPDWPLHTASANRQPSAVFAPGNLDNGKEWRGAHPLITKGCTIRGGIVDRSILSPGVYVDAEAEVLESVLLDGVRIGRGAKIRRAIIDQGTTVPPGTRIGYESSHDRKRFPVSDAGITVMGGGIDAASVAEERTADSSDYAQEVSAGINGRRDLRGSLYAGGRVAQHVA